VNVTRHRLRSLPPPESSERIGAGGLLVYPMHLYEAGAAVQFVVPQVECPPGENSQTTIGMFGIKHFTPRYQGVTEAVWSAGLTITCTPTGSPTFSVGYNGDAQEGHPEPGDVVDVSTSGGGCPSLVIGFRQPHPKERQPRHFRWPRLRRRHELSSPRDHWYWVPMSTDRRLE
jgi:hypothetical protein